MLDHSSICTRLNVSHTLWGSLTMAFTGKFVCVYIYVYVCQISHKKDFLWNTIMESHVLVQYII